MGKSTNRLSTEGDEVKEFWLFPNIRKKSSIPINEDF